MGRNGKKVIQIEVEESMHTEFKLHCKMNFSTIKGRIQHLIQDDIKNGKPKD